MLSITTNLSSLITQNSMNTSTNKLNQAIERMSTGFKINHAKDNAANYSINTQLSTKISAYQIAEDNCSMGLDMVQTASSSLEQIQDKLERLRALQEQASNGTYGEKSLDAINSEVNALVDEISRIYNTTEYNGIKLFGDNAVGGSGYAAAALTAPTTVGIATNSLDGENIATYSSTVRYTQYDDDYVLTEVHPLDPKAYAKVSFSDGTQLAYSTTHGEKITWGDLVIPDTYTWSENGYYVDSSGRAMRLIIENSNAISTEDLMPYGIKYTITPDPDPTPTPDPDPEPAPTPDPEPIPTPTPPTPSKPQITYAPDSILLQVGIDGEWNSQIAISTKFELTGLEDLCDIGLDTMTDFLTKIDSLLGVISEKQTEFGSVENRLTSALEQIAVSYDNLVSTRSTIRDADVAEESSAYIRNQILQQAASTLMATANQTPSIALQLL